MRVQSATTSMSGRSIVIVAASVALSSACAHDRSPSAPVAARRASVATQAQPSGELRAYVTNRASNEVSVIRVADHVVLATIPVAEEPQHVTVTPDGRFAYITHRLLQFQSGVGVTVLRTIDNSTVATLAQQAGQSFSTTVITKDGLYAYLINGFYSQTNAASHLQVIRTQDYAVVSTIDSGPHTMGAFNSTGEFLYVTGGCVPHSESCVSAIRVADNAIVSRIPASSLPNRIVLTPDDARAYVSHNGSDVIAVIRTSDNAVETTFASPSSLGLGMSRDGARLYVTNHHVAGAVSVIRTADHGVEATVGVGDLPAHVEVTPDGSAAYVPNSGSGTVSVIRTADHAVVATIPVGGSPGFVAFAFVRSSLDEIDELRDAIGGLLATGGLNGGQAGALDNHLMNALRALERGQTSPAVAQLEAFIMQIQQFVADGVLTEAEVAPLIAAAKNAIAGLAA